MSETVEEAVAVIKRALVKTKGVAVEQLSENTAFSDLDMKSTNFVHVINDLEEEFEIEVPFMAFRRRKTIEDAAQFIEEMLES